MAARKPSAASDTAPFALHPRLAADGLAVGDLPLSRVLLMNNRLFPWLILVPRQPELRELTDLAYDDLHRLTDEIAAAAAVMQETVAPDKLNIATLGNRVPQLHIHIIGRLTTDAAWPDPAWGRGAEPYRQPEQEQILPLLQKSFASREKLFQTPNNHHQS